MRSLRRRRLPNRGILGLSAALAAGALLLAMPPVTPKPPPAPPVSAGLAWPGAETGTMSALLPDGSTYAPKAFLDARTSVGSAPTPDRKYLRLLWRGPDDRLRQLRRLPMGENPFFGNVTAADGVLVWAEGSRTGRLRLWTIRLDDNRPAQPVTSDTGQATLNDSQYSLTLHDGRVYWVAADPDRVDASQIRSVALTGGPVQRRRVAGTWELSSWPWLVNGATEPGGSTRMRNLLTQKEIAVHRSPGLQTTSCSPTWCRVVALAKDGSSRMELKHPDGSARQRVAGDLAQPAISDVLPLDRFEIVAQGGPNTDLTRNAQLLVFEITTRQTVELSRDAATVLYTGGVLWWSNGTQEAVNWHSLDLRTI